MREARVEIEVSAMSDAAQQLVVLECAAEIDKQGAIITQRLQLTFRHSKNFSIVIENGPVILKAKPFTLRTKTFDHFLC